MSSGFFTEAEIEEAKTRRQEEWEKVRKPEDPLEAPEPQIDGRSLYDRLQEQKQKKDLEYEEAHKLKNMVKGLDDDEIDFLDLVDRSKLAADRKKHLEEEKELDDYRNRVATLQEKSFSQKLQAEVNVNKPKAVPGSRASQTKLLKGIIVTKNDAKKRQISETDEKVDESICSKKKKTDAKNANDVGELINNSSGDANDKNKVVAQANSLGNTGLVCIGILPGLGHYQESSSDECSSDSDQDSPVHSRTPLDLLGRKIKKDKET